MYGLQSRYTTIILIQHLESNEGIEPSFSDWKSDVLTIIRIRHLNWLPYEDLNPNRDLRRIMSCPVRRYGNFMVGKAGIEPTTFDLDIRCSTAELFSHIGDRTKN